MDWMRHSIDYNFLSEPEFTSSGLARVESGGGGGEGEGTG